MPQQQLALSTLGSLRDGLAESMVNAALTAALQDCADRGEDEKERKAVITVTFAKCEGGEILVGLEAATKIPAYRIAPTRGEVVEAERGKPVLLFREDSPNDPRQRTIRDANGGEVDG